MNWYRVFSTIPDAERGAVRVDWFLDVEDWLLRVLRRGGNGPGASGPACGHHDEYVFEYLNDEDVRDLSRRVRDKFGVDVEVAQTVSSDDLSDACEAAARSGRPPLVDSYRSSERGAVCPYPPDELLLMNLTEDDDIGQGPGRRFRGVVAS